MKFTTFGMIKWLPLHGTKAFTTPIPRMSLPMKNGQYIYPLQHTTSLLVTSPAASLKPYPTTIPFHLFQKNTQCQWPS